MAPLLAPGALIGPLAWYAAMVGPEFGQVPAVDVPTTFLWSDAAVAVSRDAADACVHWVDGAYARVDLPGVSQWMPDQSPRAVGDAVSAHLRPRHFVDQGQSEPETAPTTGNPCAAGKTLNRHRGADDHGGAADVLAGHEGERALVGQPSHARHDVVGQAAQVDRGAAVHPPTRPRRRAACRRRCHRAPEDDGTGHAHHRGRNERLDQPLTLELTRGHVVDGAHPAGVAIDREDLRLSSADVDVGVPVRQSAWAQAPGGRRGCRCTCRPA